jgi:hypothetical protein
MKVNMKKIGTILFFAGGFLWLAKAFYDRHRLTQNFKITSAEVTNVSNVFRQGGMWSLTYKYTVDDKQYNGGANYSRCGNITIALLSDSLLATTVLVAYYPENPSISTSILTLDNAKRFNVKPTAQLLHYDSIVTCK